MNLDSTTVDVLEPVYVQHVAKGIPPGAAAREQRLAQIRQTTTRQERLEALRKLLETR